jgi:hypothetical protein
MYRANSNSSTNYQNNINRQQTGAEVITKNMMIAPNEIVEEENEDDYGEEGS